MFWDFLQEPGASLSNLDLIFSDWTGEKEVWGRRDYVFDRILPVLRTEFERETVKIEVRIPELLTGWAILTELCVVGHLVAQLRTALQFCAENHEGMIVKKRICGLRGFICMIWGRFSVVGTIFVPRMSLYQVSQHHCQKWDTKSRLGAFSASARNTSIASWSTSYASFGIEL